jgi:hypothetical protein
VGGAVDEDGELAGVRDGGLGQDAEDVPRVDRACVTRHNDQRQVSRLDVALDEDVSEKM